MTKKVMVICFFLCFSKFKCITLVIRKNQTLYILCYTLNINSIYNWELEFEVMFISFSITFIFQKLYVMNLPSFFNRGGINLSKCDQKLRNKARKIP